MRLVTDLSFAAVPGPPAAGPQGTPGADPATLFAAGAAGFWYDPSDLSTLWQDTAGTVPVTAAGQAVARIDDKSGNGHHLVQAAVGSRPVLARWPVSGRRNRIGDSGNFTSTAWGKRSGALAHGPDQVYLPQNPFSADTDLGAGIHQYWYHPRVLGVKYVATVWVPAASGWSDQTAQLQIGLSGSPATNVTVTPQAVSQVITLTMTPTGVGNWARIGFRASKNLTLTGLGPVQLERADAATPYQRVTGFHDVGETEEARMWVIAFDGTDDHLASSAPVDLTQHRALTLGAAFRPETKGTLRALIDHAGDPTTTAGAFALVAPEAAQDRIVISARSTAGAAGVAGAGVAPTPFRDTMHVAVGRIDFDAAAGQEAALRFDGADLGQTDGLGEENTGTLGTGSLRLGGNPSTPFGGAFAGLVGVAGQAAPATAAMLEAHLTARLGAAPG